LLENMPVLREKLKPELRELTGLENVLIFDIYGENTGTHKDYKSYLWLKDARLANSKTVVLITSGNQGQSFNERCARGQEGYAPEEVIHFVPEDTPKEVIEELEKFNFSRVMKWRRDEFLDRELISMLIGKDDFFYAEESFDYQTFNEMLTDMGMLSYVRDSDYVGVPYGTGDLAVAVIHPRLDVFTSKTKAICIVPKGEHPLSKTYKKFRSINSLADKLSTNFISDFNRQITERAIKEGNCCIVEVDNDDIRKAMEYGKIQEIEAEPSGLVSLSLLDKNLRDRYGLNFQRDSFITLYITGRYGRKCEVTYKMYHGIVYADVKRIKEK